MAEEKHEGIERCGVPLNLLEVRRAPWTIEVKADVNDADYVKEVFSYTNDEFEKEGLAVAMMLYRASGRHVYENLTESICELLLDYLPSVPYDGGEIHTIVSVDVRYQEGDKVYSLNFEKVSEEKEYEAIKNFLMDAYSWEEKRVQVLMSKEWDELDEDDFDV